VLSNYHQQYSLIGPQVFVLTPCFCVILPISSSLFSRLSEVFQEGLCTYCLHLGSELFGECAFFMSFCVYHITAHTHLSVLVPYYYIPVYCGPMYCRSHILYIIPFVLWAMYIYPWYCGLTYCVSPILYIYVPFVLWAHIL
jgi:hypothetical protein